MASLYFDYRTLCICDNVAFFLSLFTIFMPNNVWYIFAMDRNFEVWTFTSNLYNYMCIFIIYII